jgi:hypothetical protein
MEFTREVLERLASTAEGMPVYLDQREPELEDPSQELGTHQWRPACVATGKLTRCLEAVRDIATALGPLSQSLQPAADKRLVKQAIPPIYNLAISIRDLFNYVQSNCWGGFDKQKRAKLVKRFNQFGETMSTVSGALKTARDKIAAHLDKDVCTTEYRRFWDSFGISDILGWINGCLRMLRVLILPDI